MPEKSKIFPRLKAGVRSWRTATGELRIGTRIEHTTLPSEIAGIPLHPFINALDGRSLQSLSEALYIEEARILTVLSALNQLDLIDTEYRAIPYLARYNSESGKNEDVLDAESLPSDPALIGYLARFSIEAEAATHLPGVIDGGRGTLVNRRAIEIAIHGNDRFALALFGALLASGFSNTRMIHPPTQRTRAPRVEAKDLIGGFLRTSDLEISKRVAVEELERSSLFNFNSEQPETKTLMIYSRTPRADEIQELMSKEIPHLFVNVLDAGRVRVGPLVIPGQTPCFRCLRLNEQESCGFNAIDERPSVEIGTALANLLAGSITSDLIRYSHDNSTRFENKVWTYQIGQIEDRPPQVIRIHPTCGCAWGHFKSRNR